MKIFSQYGAMIGKEVDGKLTSTKVLAGEHNYADIDPKNPRTCEDLRMLRDDMGVLKFDTVLPCDKAPKMSKDALDAAMDASDARRPKVKKTVKASKKKTVSDKDGDE